jgi:hypothetical protein
LGFKLPAFNKMHRKVRHNNHFNEGKYSHY